MHLEYDNSFSQVGILGVDSERILLPPSGVSGKELEISLLMLEVDTGVWVSRRMFPSDKDLLNSDLQTQKMRW